MSQWLSNQTPQVFLGWDVIFSAYIVVRIKLISHIAKLENLCFFQEKKATISCWASLPQGMGDHHSWSDLSASRWYTFSSINFLFVYGCCFSQVLCSFFVVLDLQLRTISKQTNLKAMVGLIMNCKKAFNDPWTNKKNSSVTKWALICGIMMQEGVQNAF